MRVLDAAVRAGLSGLVILLAACAHTPVAIPPNEAAPEFDQAPPPPAAPLGAIDPEKLTDAIKSRQLALMQLLKPSIARGEIDPPQAQGSDLRLHWREAALFEPGSAQLRTQSLVVLAHCARWLRADGDVVLHVIGSAPADENDALRERRTGAVAAFLIAEGALPERLRASVQLRAPAAKDTAEGVDHPAADAIIWIIEPVILGREALAWVPPAV